MNKALTLGICILPVKRPLLNQLYTKMYVWFPDASLDFRRMEMT